MTRKILLVEPAYKNKYPPIGLMKISSYHKTIGDEVVFCKGTDSRLQKQSWDRVYITTLFTFQWKVTIKTIRYYLECVKDHSSIFVGGPMATIMKDEILSQDGLEKITIVCGLLNKANVLDETNYIVDDMVPDYSLLDIKNNPYLKYEYPVSDAYFVHATRGCVRKCEFCSIPKIEPKFEKYKDIKINIAQVKKLYGERKDLMMMDNNIVASSDLEQIVEDIIACGFGVNNNNYSYKANGKERTKKRFVDFNQGLDARLLYNNPEKIKLLSRVAVKPIRIAFDHADDEFVEIYTKCMKLVAENGIKHASNYILFNFEDEPNDLYKRLEVNIKLNKEFEEEGCNTRIWSFPMRFAPIVGEESKGRKYLGKNWTRKQIRGIQCILNATHGVVGPKEAYFKNAFGSGLDEFNKLLWMPEKYIIYRKDNLKNKNTLKWEKIFSSLDEETLNNFKKLIGDNQFKDKHTDNPCLKDLLSHYLI